MAFEPVAPTFATVPVDDDPLSALVVEPERSDAGYDRGLFEHWIDADGDGCDTRCEVLEAEVRSDLPGLDSGWLSIYDGYTTANPAELEVDHVVALSEAWRSGADSWTTERRGAFANDIELADALVAATIISNQSKSDRDAAEWQPPDSSAWCWWATATVAVKAKWGLSVDQGEAEALRNVLADC